MEAPLEGGPAAASPAAGGGQAKACPTPADAVRILLAPRCVCHKAKKPRMAFCGDCFHGLPPAMQKALYRRIGSGFEEAYQAAKEWMFRGDE